MKLLRQHYILISLLIVGVGFALLAYTYFIEPDRLVVNRSTITIEKLDPALNGLRIVMLSDIHGGSNNVTEEKIREIVRLTNEQEPDLIVLLGDYVSEDRSGRLKMPLETIATNLNGLSAKYGVFAVLGNHDGVYGDDAVARELTRVGIIVLQNEIAAININGRTLRILGLKDQLKIETWESFSDVARKVLSDSSASGDVIVLEHSPDILPIITGDLLISDELRLILAAHTHGGQVWLPLLGTPIVPSSYGQKYSYGHIRENGVDMFVTSGIGTSILPIRFMMPPEIAVLTLRSGK